MKCIIRCAHGKRWFVIGTTVLGLALLLGFSMASSLDWQYLMRTGRFASTRIVEVLNSPVTIVSVTEAGLLTSDGRTLPVPGVSKLHVPASVKKFILENGVEVRPDGSIYALLRVHHWCGNDPVRFHLGRIDLSTLLLFLERDERFFVADYGIDPGFFHMCRVPHEEYKPYFDTPKSR